MGERYADTETGQVEHERCTVNVGAGTGERRQPVGVF